MLRNKTRMALRILAVLNDQKRMKLEDVAEQCGVCLSYIEQVVALLKPTNVIDGKRGPNGGYIINQSILDRMKLGDLDLACYPDDIESHFEDESVLLFDVSELNVGDMISYYRGT